MGFIGSQYRWVFASAGVRTRIYSGPFLHGAPVQWVQFARTARGLPSVPMTFTVELYSAAPPWYFNASGAATAWRNFAIPTPPGAVNPLPSVDIQKLPSDAGYPIWALAGPWADCIVTPSVTCMANFWVL